MSSAQATTRRSLPGQAALIAVAFAAATLAGCGGAGPAGTTGPTSAAHGQTPTQPSARPTGTAPQPAKRPDHLVIVIFENKADSQINSDNAPWLTATRARSAIFTNATAITHPSQPNYLALFSGSTQGIDDDRCDFQLGDRPNLASQLYAAGRTFTAYSESLPSAGWPGCTSGGYVAKHAPWSHFGNVPADDQQPFSAFPADFNQLPAVSFVVPNLCHDMHDCPIATGDAWGAAHLSAYQSWARDHNSLLAVTFDEDDKRAGNRILTMIDGAGVRAGGYPGQMDHYRLLATVEWLFGLSRLGEAEKRQPATEAFA